MSCRFGPGCQRHREISTLQDTLNNTNRGNIIIFQAGIYTGIGNYNPNSDHLNDLPLTTANLLRAKQ